MSETSSAASFRWDDTRYAASRARRSCLRSIPAHEERTHRQGGRRGRALELVPQLDAGLVEAFVRRATCDRLSGGGVVVGRHHPPILIEAVSDVEPDMKGAL